MQRFLGAFIFFIFHPAFANESAVYLCRTHGWATDIPVRMKTYHDKDQQSELGKVDRMNGDEVLRSTITKILRVPLLDRDAFVQIWYGEDITLSAQLEFNQGRRPFQASYKSETEKLHLLCQEIRD